ncbi:unnamed protein product [Effrenium voratum]|nr:unnamed protein product [Effrenium voratum]
MSDDPVEILHLTWAAVPLDAEGLFFGRGRVIEAFRLLGRAGTATEAEAERDAEGPGKVGLSKSAELVVQEQRQLDQRLLGWCSMHAAGPPGDLTFSERRLHRALASQEVVGCRLWRTQGSVRGIFGQEACSFVGSEMKPRALKVRSIGTTTGLTEGAQLQVRGRTADAMASLAENLAHAKEDLTDTVLRQLADIDASAATGDLAAGLRAAQRAAAFSSVTCDAEEKSDEGERNAAAFECPMTIQELQKETAYGVIGTDHIEKVQIEEDADIPKFVNIKTKTRFEEKVIKFRLPARAVPATFQPKKTKVLVKGQLCGKFFGECEVSTRTVEFSIKLYDCGHFYMKQTLPGSGASPYWVIFEGRWQTTEKGIAMEYLFRYAWQIAKTRLMPDFALEAVPKDHRSRLAWCGEIPEQQLNGSAPGPTLG